MGVHTTFVRSVDLDEWTQRQIDAMRLGGNENARQFFRKNGHTDLHGKIEKKYTSKAAKAYRVELQKLVELEASKRGEATTATTTNNEETPNLLLSNLEISAQSEQDAMARQKIAQARAAHAQPVEAKAPMASQLPGASKLVTNLSTISSNGTKAAGNSPSTTATPLLRKPASSSNTKLFLKKKSSSSVGSSKLRINKLVTSNSSLSNGDDPTNFDEFGASLKAEEEAVAAAAARKKQEEEAEAVAERAKQLEAAAAQKEREQHDTPPASSMEQGVARLKAMNSDFFADM